MGRMNWQDKLEDAVSKHPKSLMEMGREFSVTTTQDFSLPPFERAEGPFVYDIFGKEYVDFSSGVGSANLGYGVREIIESVGYGFDRSCGVPDHDWQNHITSYLKKRLCEITPGKFPKKVILVNSGTEAVEAAIKILLAKRPERKKFIVFDGAFHGRTLGSLSLHGSKPLHREGFPVALRDICHFPFPEKDGPIDLGHWFHEFYHRVLKPTFAIAKVNAVFIELVQGEGGVNVVDGFVLSDLLRLLRKHDIKLVIDEVQTGFYRMGKMFACEHFGLEPDIICLGKSLGGGGFPMSAAVINAELDFDKFGRHSNTSGGMAPIASAALTMIELLTESLDKKLLSDNIRILSKFAPEGLGLMRRWRFESTEMRDGFVEEAKKSGILLLGAGTKNVRFMPQVNMLTPLLEEVIEKLKLIDIPHL